MAKKIKVTVDKNLCIGCGACVAIAPDLFQLDENGKSEFVGEVTEENMDLIDRAISICPTQAIKKEEVDE